MVEKLLVHQPLPENREQMLFLLSQLARKTDHRELNLSDVQLNKILSVYPDEHLKDCLLKERALTQSEQEQVFGDRLPAGLVLEL